jgi:putative toxin-antitoxin system antitoxin component (TIGR02293 family)
MSSVREVQEPFIRDMAVPVEFKMGPGAWEEAIRDGLDKQTFEDIALKIGGDEKAARAIIYSVIPRATWERRADKLEMREGEVVERFVRLWDLALEVWGTPSEARAFMMAQHPMLSERTPLDSALTEVGGRRVERILRALQFGLPV